MKAMLLAAGRGERMGPLTSEMPKPLLSLGSETLIGRHLRRLAAAGFSEIVINLSYRGEQIRAAIGDTTPWGQTVVYSEEGEPPLETAGGIVQALPLLGDEPFLVVSTDVVSDFDFSSLRMLGADSERFMDRQAGEFAPLRKPGTGAPGYLVLVPNPPHHPDGDFGLTPEGRLQTPDGRLQIPDGRLRMPHGRLDSAPPCYTFSGVAVLRPALFQGLAPGIRPLRDVLRPAVRRGALFGEVFEGLWRDVGTPDRLADVRGLMESRQPQASGDATS